MEFYRETEFKETEIGRIPKDWDIRKLGQLFEVKTGTTPSTRNEGYWKGGSINWLTPDDLSIQNGRIYIDRGERRITENALREYALNLLPVKSLIISTRAPVGYVAVLNKEATFNQGCKGLMPKDLHSIYPEYYFYYLISKKVELENKSGGSTFKEISKKMLESFPLPHPIFSEQKQVALVLLRIDELIQQTDSIIRKTQELKKGLMQELLTKGLGHKEFKYSEELGCEIPKEWEVKKIEDLCDILDNQRIPLNEEARRGMQGDIPYYGANGVLDFINDYIYDDKLILIAEDGGYFDEYATRPIAYMVEGKCWVNNHAHVLKVKENEGFVTEFVFYSLEHKNIIPYIKGSTRSKLNQNELRMISVGMPKLKEEQQEISSILLDVDNKNEEEKRTKQYLENLKKGLMQILLTGQVRIKVN
jgi:type I restriction enzyme S subunit